MKILEKYMNYIFKYLHFVWLKIMYLLLQKNFA